MNRHDAYLSAEHAAELEDRAAELVDRDWLLGVERDDRAAGRADLEAADRADLIAYNTEWEACKERAGLMSDYGWHDHSRSHWDGVL